MVDRNPGSAYGGGPTYHGDFASDDTDSKTWKSRDTSQSYYDQEVQSVNGKIVPVNNVKTASIGVDELSGSSATLAAESRLDSPTAPSETSVQAKVGGIKTGDSRVVVKSYFGETTPYSGYENTSSEKYGEVRSTKDSITVERTPAEIKAGIKTVKKSVTSDYSHVRFTPNGLEYETTTTNTPIKSYSERVESQTTEGKKEALTLMRELEVMRVERIVGEIKTEDTALVTRENQAEKDMEFRNSLVAEHNKDPENKSYLLPAINVMDQRLNPEIDSLQKERTALNKKVASINADIKNTSKTAMELNRLYGIETTRSGEMQPQIAAYNALSVDYADYKAKYLNEKGEPTWTTKVEAYASQYPALFNPLNSFVNMVLTGTGNDPSKGYAADSVALAKKTEDYYERYEYPKIAFSSDEDVLSKTKSDMDNMNINPKTIMLQQIEKVAAANRELGKKNVRSQDFEYYSAVKDEAMVVQRNQFFQPPEATITPEYRQLTEGIGILDRKLGPQSDIRLATDVATTYLSFGGTAPIVKGLKAVGVAAKTAKTVGLTTQYLARQYDIGSFGGRGVQTAARALTGFDKAEDIRRIQSAVISEQKAQTTLQWIGSTVLPVAGSILFVASKGKVGKGVGMGIYAGATLASPYIFGQQEAYLEKFNPEDRSRAMWYRGVANVGNTAVGIVGISTASEYFGQKTIGKVMEKNGLDKVAVDAEKKFKWYNPRSYLPDRLGEYFPSFKKAYEVSAPGLYQAGAGEGIGYYALNKAEKYENPTFLGIAASAGIGAVSARVMGGYVIGLGYMQPPGVKVKITKTSTGATKTRNYKLEQAHPFESIKLQSEAANAGYQVKTERTLPTTGRKAEKLLQFLYGFDKEEFGGDVGASFIGKYRSDYPEIGANFEVVNGKTVVSSVVTYPGKSSSGFNRIRTPVMTASPSFTSNPTLDMSSTINSSDTSTVLNVASITEPIPTILNIEDSRTTPISVEQPKAVSVSTTTTIPVSVGSLTQTNTFVPVFQPIDVKMPTIQDVTTPSTTNTDVSTAVNFPISMPTMINTPEPVAVNEPVPVPVTVAIPSFGFPALFWPGDETPNLGPRVSRKKKTGYQASFEAIGLGIFGSKKAKSLYSGLEIRPLIGKERKPQGLMIGKKIW